jgi:hypothetical protein
MVRHVHGVRSGADVGRALERGVDALRRQLDEHVAGGRALDHHVNELVARRGEAMLDLARHYLPDIRRETIERTFVEVRDDILVVLANKQKRERQLHDQVAACERQVEHQEAELARVTGELNAHVGERERLEKLVGERLHGSDEFKRLSEQALSAETELERNEARVAEIKGEAEKKLPSYERSRLFKYLYEAGFGTPQYQAEGLTRRIDRWVARMIDFPAARRGYDFLRVTPELMAQEVARRRERFDELMQQAEAIEDRVSDEVGLTAVLRTGQELGAERDRLVAAAAKAQDELLKRQHEALALAGPKNEFYEQALARMQNFLANLPPAKLAAESRSTPEREDDAIVAEASYLSGQLAEADRQGAVLAHQQQAWDERLGALQSVLQRFRQAEFDSRRSMFAAELDPEGLVAQYLEGRLGAAELWQALDGAQHFAPEWHEQNDPSVAQPWIGDASQVLLHVLTEVAGAAMRHAASRGVERRAPVRRQARKSSGRPPFPNRGFTNGRGF